MEDKSFIYILWHESSTGVIGYFINKIDMLNYINLNYKTSKLEKKHYKDLYLIEMYYKKNVSLDMYSRFNLDETPILYYSKRTIKFNSNNYLYLCELTKPDTLNSEIFTTYNKAFDAAISWIKSESNDLDTKCQLDLEDYVNENNSEEQSLEDKLKYINYVFENESTYNCQYPTYEETLIDIRKIYQL